MCPPPEERFLDSPFFYSLVLHICTAVSTPIHFLGLYIILFKTPKSMASVKWYLLNLQIWIVLFDYSVGLLTIPVLLLPRYALIPTGILTLLGVPSMAQTFIVFVSLGYMMTSIVAIFKNRFFAICRFGYKTVLAKYKRLWILCHYLAVVLVLIIFGFMAPDQEEAKRRLIEEIPCLPDYILNSPIFIACEDYTYHLILMVFFTTLASLEVLYFVLFIGWSSIQQLRTKQISRKTFIMQRNFFIAILVQICVPMVMLLIPFCYELYSVMWNHYNQTFNNLVVITESMHGFVSTVVTLLVHRPYRITLRNILIRNFCVLEGNHRLCCQSKRNVVSPIQLY